MIREKSRSAATDDDRYSCEAARNRRVAKAAVYTIKSERESSGAFGVEDVPEPSRSTATTGDGSYGYEGRPLFADGRLSSGQVARSGIGCGRSLMVLPTGGTR